MLFTKEQVLAICKDGRREIDIAKDYHVITQNISNIKQRRHYTRWTKDVEILKFSLRKLNKKQHREIYLSKKPARIFAEKYNVHLRTISNIRRGLIYKQWANEIDNTGIGSPVRNRTRLNKQQHREVYLSEESDKILAEKYNICSGTIYNIRREKNYKSWAKEIEATPRKIRSKLNKQQHREIYLSEESHKILAEKYNISLRTIYDIKKKTTHKSWANGIDISQKETKQIKETAKQHIKSVKENADKVTKLMYSRWR